MSRRETGLLALLAVAVAVLALSIRFASPHPDLRHVMNAHGLKHGVIAYGAPGKPFTLVRMGADENDVFPYFSLSKPMTAAVVEALVREGTISLDEQVEGASVDQLLHHAGGWDREMAGDPVAGENELPRCTDAKAPPKQFEPGTRAAYSNLGYCLLGHRVEQRTGEPFEKVARRILPETRDMTYSPVLGPAGGWSGTIAPYYRFASRPVDPAALVRPVYAPTGAYYGMSWKVLEDGTLAHYGEYDPDHYSVVFKRPGWVAVGLFTGRPVDGDVTRDDLLKVLSDYR